PTGVKIYAFFRNEKAVRQRRNPVFGRKPRRFGYLDLHFFLKISAAGSVPLPAAMKTPIVPHFKELLGQLVPPRGEAMRLTALPGRTPSCVRLSKGRRDLLPVRFSGILSRRGYTMPKQFKTLETKLIHAGEPDPRIEGAVTMPIFQTAMTEHIGESTYEA